MRAIGVEEKLNAHRLGLLHRLSETTEEHGVQDESGLVVMGDGKNVVGDEKQSIFSFQGRFFPPLQFAPLPLPYRPHCPPLPPCPTLYVFCVTAPTYGTCVGIAICCIGGTGTVICAGGRV